MIKKSEKLNLLANQIGLENLKKICDYWVDTNDNDTYLHIKEGFRLAIEANKKDIYYVHYYFIIERDILFFFIGKENIIKNKLIKLLKQ